MKHLRKSLEETKKTQTKEVAGTKLYLIEKKLLV